MKIPNRVYVVVTRYGEALLVDNLKKNARRRSGDGDRTFTYQLIYTSDVIAMCKPEKRAAGKGRA
jgi:hypothetical protein